MLVWLSPLKNHSIQFDLKKNVQFNYVFESLKTCETVQEYNSFLSEHIIQTMNQNDACKN